MAVCPICILQFEICNVCCVGWALASLSGCNPPALVAVQVQLLPDALFRLARSSIGAGLQSLELARGVRFPYGLLFLAKW